MTSLGRVLTAMITPFDADGTLLPDEAANVAEYLLAHGHDGVVVSGTTGESPALDDDEKCVLFATVKERLGSRGTVIAGTGDNNTTHSVAFTKRVAKLGVDAVLAVVPAYSKPTQDGMLRHFGAIAEASSVPVVLYNVPSRTGQNILPATVHELARRHANIVGIKESSGDPNQFSTLIRENPREDFTVWCGDDYFFLPALALGAHGVVSVAGHLCGDELRAMLEAFTSGDVARAGAIHRGLQPLFSAIFATTSPIPIKWAMNELGFAAGPCRSPLGEMPESLAAALRPLIAPYRSLVRS